MSVSVPVSVRTTVVSCVLQVTRKILSHHVLQNHSKLEEQDFPLLELTTCLLAYIQTARPDRQKLTVMEY